MREHSQGGEPGPSGGGGAVLDRSRVRVLLCDPDPKCSQEVLFLLSRCSYQVTSAKSARQVIDTLNAQGADIDIILAEVDLPYAKGFKMLKYIARNKDLRRIPIIMMSSQDEVSVVVKCLRLGAADFLVKPLRMNELLNLWTHVWRRRRMLGLPEKEFFSNEIELVVSDPSDANTNSTILLSDDTEEKLEGNTVQETSMSVHLDKQLDTCPYPLQNLASEDLSVSSGDGEQTSYTEGFFSPPMKTDLKVAKSSAFLAYVKPIVPVPNTSHPLVERSTIQPSSLDHCTRLAVTTDLNEEASSSFGDLEHESSKMHLEAAGMQSHSPPINPHQMEHPSLPMLTFPFFYPGGMEQAAFASSMQAYHESRSNLQTSGSSSSVPQYNVYSQCHQAAGMTPFPYDPIVMAPMGWQSGQFVASPAVWRVMPSSSAQEEKGSPSERRAAALVKFRQKRKKRCFDKKIRYINRKKLAETRPRIRGQFVRHATNEDAGLAEVSVGDDNTEDEEEEPTSRELEISSPE